MNSKQSALKSMDPASTGYARAKKTAEGEIAKLAL
jgi:hypothetical protein